MRRIGLLGGTFDPIHFGHLRSAVEAKQSLQLDELRLVPAARPPHRGLPGATAEQRAEMLSLALEGQDELQRDLRELTRAGASYSVDTLEELHAEASDEIILYLLVGWDAFCGLPEWDRWLQIFKLAQIVVLNRPFGTEPPGELEMELRRREVTYMNQFDARSGQIFRLPITPLGISASAIRAEVARGRSPRYLLPKPVLDYIFEHNLYQ